MRGLWAGLRGHLIVIGVLIGCAAAAAPAGAQPFPSRPITLVVPFAAGGPTDTLARILSERIAAELHTTVVVENVAGASGSIAGARVARATPDGTTITIGLSVSCVTGAKAVAGSTGTCLYRYGLNTSGPGLPRRSV